MEDKYNGERIMVFERQLLEELGPFQGTRRDTERYLGSILDRRHNRYHPRFQAEADESLKQLIPYVIFVRDDEVYSYVRGKQAGEARLVGNRSIGVGGHINPGDEMQLFAAPSDRAAYLEAVRRELAEEVTISGSIEPEIIAVLNDDSNAVGRVHFGVVHLCRLAPGVEVVKREAQLTQSGFVPIAELATTRRAELESWSALCIDLIAARG